MEKMQQSVLYKSKNRRIKEVSTIALTLFILSVSLLVAPINKVNADLVTFTDSTTVENDIKALFQDSFDSMAENIDFKISGVEIAKKFLVTDEAGNIHPDLVLKSIFADIFDEQLIDMKIDNYNAYTRYALKSYKYSVYMLYTVENEIISGITLTVYYDLTWRDGAGTAALEGRDAVIDHARIFLDSYAYTSLTTEYDRLEAINNYICSTFQYDYRLFVPSMKFLTNYTAFKMISDSGAIGGYPRGVCQAYAMYGYIMLKEAGFEAITMDGWVGTENHAWNTVKVGTKWYHIDFTWDDPISYIDEDPFYKERQYEEGIVSTFYLLLSDSELSIDHEWNLTQNGYTYPVADAEWTDGLIQYAVTFNSQDGSEVEGKTTDYNTSISVPTAPTRTGYTFGGWYKETDCVNTWTFATDKVTSNTTLYAKWTINTYTVIFRNWDGSTLKTQNVDYSGAATAPADPTKTGYTFSGWDVAFNNITANLAVTAQYTINTYTITFNSQGGSSVPSKTADYNTSITAPTAPTRTGYTFGGWYKEAGCTNAWNFTTDKVTAAKTLYAKWTINSFTVTFNSTSGSSVATKTANYNTSITAPTNPTRSGYAFVGWYTTSSYTTPWVFATNKVTANITLYAKWMASPTAGLKAASSGYNSIKLTWTATSGASNYEIYRSAASNGTYSLVTTIAAASPSYTNTGLTTGTTYYYKVRAYALVGTTKVYNGYSAVASAKPLPATPTALKAASASYNSIKLTWTAVTGASGYGIYRATSATGTYTLLTTATTAYYTNTGLTTGKAYYYKVAAYRLVGSTKVYGSQAAAVSSKAIPATVGTITAARASSTSIKVSWGAISGASGYEVWRSTSSSGTYTLVKTQTALSFANTGLKTGTTYYYKVRAYRLVGSTKVYGGYSVVKYAKP